MFFFFFFSLPFRFKTFDITKPLWLENTIVLIDLALYGMKSSDEALQWTHAQLSSDTCDRLNRDHVPKKTTVIVLKITTKISLSIFNRA